VDVDERQIYSIDGVIPVIHPSTFIDKSAVIIGDVHIGANCYIGPNACIRGDFGRIEIAADSNVQDNCTIHCMTGIPTIIGRWGHIGHGAVVHSAQLAENVLVGMNAVVMNDVILGKNSVVAAMAFVKTGMVVAENTLIAGTPAREVRTLSAEEIQWKLNGSKRYTDLATRCIQSLKKVQPLTEIELNRPHLNVDLLNKKL